MSFVDMFMKITVIFSLLPLRTRKSENFREREREPSKKKQRTDTKKDAKKIRSDNFTRNNREKSDIAINE